MHFLNSSCQLHLCPQYARFVLLFRVDNRYSMLFKCLQISYLNVSNLCYHPKQDSFCLPSFPPALLYSLETQCKGRARYQNTAHWWKSNWGYNILFMVLVIMVPWTKFSLIPIILPFLRYFRISLEGFILLVFFNPVCPYSPQHYFTLPGEFWTRRHI